MATALDRTDQTQFEHRVDLCSSRDRGIRSRIALWPQRRCARLFCGDDVVARAPSGMVCTWNRRFLPGYRGGCEPAFAFRRRGCGLCLWHTTPIRLLVAP